MKRLAVHASVVVAGLFAAGAAAADPAGTIRNPFARPSAAPSAAGDGPGGPPSEAVFELRATLAAGPESLANVNGHIVRVGAEVDGFRLVSVTEGAAVFVKAGTRYEFAIHAAAEPDDAPSADSP